MMDVIENGNDSKNKGLVYPWLHHYMVQIFAGHHLLYFFFHSHLQHQIVIDILTSQILLHLTIRRIVILVRKFLYEIVSYKDTSVINTLW